MGARGSLGMSELDSVGLDPHTYRAWRADDYNHKVLEVQTFALPKNNPPPAWVATNNARLLGAFAPGKRLLSPHSTPFKKPNQYVELRIGVSFLKVKCT